MSTEYFSTLPTDRIGKELCEKIDKYYQYLNFYGRINLWREVYRAYYSGVFTAGSIDQAGSQGEYKILRPNHFRNIIQHMVINVTKDKIAWMPESANTDSKSMKQTLVAKNILDNYESEYGLDMVAKQATELSILFDHAYIHAPFDTDIGSDVRPDENGRMIKSGDFKFEAKSPLDVISATTIDSQDDWRIVRTLVNKYEMASKYPQFADKIAKLELPLDQYFSLNYNKFFGETQDLVYFYTFYHRKSAAVPSGRVIEFFSHDTIVLDSAMPFERMPIFKMQPDRQYLSPFGYSVAYDLAVIQNAINIIYSAILTNQATFGVNNIAIPNGAGISAELLAEGLRAVKYDPKSGAPSVLELLSTPEEMFKMIDKLEQVMQILVGLSGVVRGDPEASLKSGSALALVASQFIQFNSGLSRSYSDLLKEIGTSIISTLKKPEFGNTPRTMAMVGKTNRSYMKEFTSEDLSGIRRVRVNQGNPLSKTISGKIEIAKDLLAAGKINTPEEYQNIITTGNIESLYEGEEAELMLVRAENERLSDGKPVLAVLTDDHSLHIREHRAVLSSPDARERPEIVNNTLAHMQEHLEILGSGGPILAILGQPTMTQPIQSGAGVPTDLQEQPDMPSMPTNPLTGQEFNNNDGGIPQ